MQRVLIVGCSGAGKSFLSRQLAERTGLPLIHLDKEYWLPGWTEPPKDIWRAKVEAMIALDRWIMDGNFGGTQDRRMERADTIIHLDFPRWRCLVRILRRWWTYRATERLDMAPGCRERLDWSFLVWVWHFRARTRPPLLSRLDRWSVGRQIVMLKTPTEVVAFLEDLPARELSGQSET
jgi:adenylate kinase family enzyme